MRDVQTKGKKTRSGNNKNKDLKSFKGFIIGNSQGYAFCRLLEGENMPDFFIPAHRLKGAVDKDIVIIKPVKNSRKNEKSSEAEVIKIIERGNKNIVGIFNQGKSASYIIPDNKKFSKKIIADRDSISDAKNGDRVVAQLLWQPSDLSFPIGKIIENLGASNDIESYELGIIREHNLFEVFPNEVINASEKLNTKTDEFLKSRRDLRKEKIFTIDGADAKDLDDAVSISKLGDNVYRLGVHIADVGHYVRKGSVIDIEAFNRGTSVYFPNSVLPMLPKKLSNDLCSLNEKTDKLTLSVFMDIDEKARILNYEICESVINSVHRLTYDEVYKLLCRDKEVISKLKDIEEDLLDMAKLSKILENFRKDRGALDFDIPECYFEINEKNEVVKVKKRERNDAHKMIESFMIAANEAIAKHFFELKIPFVYRIHEKPNKDKLAELTEFVQSLGFSMPAIPKKLNSAFFEEIINLSDEESIKESLSKMVLRSMQKAIYSEGCIGHFGLASEMYCHFTSPIRRYPDLTIHRIIKDYLNNKIKKENLNELINFVKEASLQSSECERNADDAERDVDDLRKAQFMLNKIGETFDGIISSITNFGVFVELPDTVEGIVKLDSLPGDKYSFNSASKKLTNIANNYKLGDKIKVKLINVNLQERRIEFIPKGV